MTGRDWVWVRGKAPVIMPKGEKQETMEICEKFIALSIAPHVVRPFNSRIKRQQCVGISLKPHKNFLRFALRIKDTRDDVTESEYEILFARIEYRAPDRFLCSYRADNGEWVDFTFGQPEPLPACLKLIVEQPHFLVMEMFGS